MCARHTDQLDVLSDVCPCSIWGVGVFLAVVGIILLTVSLLNYIVPDRVHVMVEGRIIRSGDKDLAVALERHGYVGLDGNGPAGADGAAGSNPAPEPAGTS